MWQPPQRIKHPLPETKWPSKEEASSARLFQPITIGPIDVATRTWIPAMVPWRATEDGFVSQDVIDWYARFAEGKPGVIVVEATGIRDIPSGPLLRIGHERFVEGLSKLVAAVKEASSGETKVFIQLIDFLQIKRRPPKDKFMSRFLRLGEPHREGLARVTGDESWMGAEEETVRAKLIELKDDELATILSEREMEDYQFGYRERVWDTHLPQIRELPQVLPALFADAAERAFTAGFDGVELHYAHAYTMASFLSALNTREDGYGGPRENRVKLPLEVIAAVRERVGADKVLGLRFLGEDVIEGGSTLEDACFFGEQFAEAGVDFLSVSKGGKFEDAKAPKVGKAAYPYTGPSGYECMPTIYSDEKGPFGRNVALSTAIKRTINEAGHHIPVVTAGGICTFEMAEEILQKEEADIIGSARQCLADPDWFLKVREGCGSQVRRCEYTNYCEGLDQNHKQVTCKLWDRLDMDEEGISKDHSGKRRLLAPKWRRDE